MLLNKIVVAEDDDAIAHMVNMALGDGGFLCLRASTGEEALQLVRMHTPDLLVLDVMMPGLDGLEVARRLRADVLLSRTPILMLTALASVDNKVEGLDAGADDYLVKPFDLRELAARVRALVRASKREGDRNPTTSLPGSGAIESHISGVLAGGDAAAVIHFDLAYFDRYADLVGFSRAEQLVVDLGKLVLARCQAEARGAFVGHLGGVDFVSVVGRGNSAEALAQQVIDGFEANRSAWTSEAVAAAGDQADQAAELAATMGMAIAIAPTDGLGAEGSDELAVRLASAMRASKQAEGSSFVVWKPETA